MYFFSISELCRDDVQPLHNRVDSWSAPGQIHHLGHIREQGAARHDAQPRHQGGRRGPGVLQHLQPAVSLLRH